MTLEIVGTLRWDGPSISVELTITGKAILSDKDSNASLLAAFNNPFTFER